MTSSLSTDQKIFRLLRGETDYFDGRQKGKKRKRMEPSQERERKLSFIIRKGKKEKWNQKEPQGKGGRPHVTGRNEKKTPRNFKRELGKKGEKRGIQTEI